MLILSFFFIISSLDPNSNDIVLRDLLKELPKAGDLVVGTSSGESPFEFQFEWEEPAMPEPRIFSKNSGSIHWTDAIHLRAGSHMLVGEKKIELNCAIVLGDVKTQAKDPQYRIELMIYPKHERCGSAEPHEANPNWLSYTYNSERPQQVLGPQFSHLYNRFNAVYSQP